VAESLLLIFPGMATWFGWHWLFEQKLFAAWVLDFILAFIAGIFFQYFAIAPMRNLPPRQGIVAALKADSLSLTAWQIGMYGVMALLQYKVFKPLLGSHVTAAQPEFWLAMQWAMIGGFITSYPVNWWLIRARIKEAM
jgi:Sec-independent protein secretion pathway component TatC